MTVTINPPERGVPDRLRFSSLETLGFSDSTSVWSDSPVAVLDPPSIQHQTPRRGRHEAPETEPDPLADWRPEDIGGRLTGGNVRWGLIIVSMALVAVLAGFAYWLYQRPAALQEASAIDLVSRAAGLDAALPVLEEFNDALLIADPATGPSALFAVESEARSVFEAAGGLASAQTELRRAASEAAGSALDGVRLATEAHAYRAAALPILAAPEFETDPSLIELDEAARDFGDWQLAFDVVRTALSESVMSDATQQLDILSGDLNALLTRYVDALREDDMAGAGEVVSDLETRLEEIGEVLERSVEEVQTRVSIRIDETKGALDRLLSD